MKLKFGLAGNPNCGKTTMFNALTGANQYVGNWPGVTVEKKSGKLKGAGSDEIEIVDLPGIYSLSPYTLEEVVTADFILKDKPDVIINIVDATNIERNLYLTTQIIETGVPVVIALNMTDLIAKNVNFINNSASCAGVDTAFGYDALVIRTDIAVGEENMVLLEAQCAAFYNGPDLIEVWTLLPAESAYLYDEQAAAELQSDRADLEAFIASLNFPPYEDAQEE